MKPTTTYPLKTSLILQDLATMVAGKKWEGASYPFFGVKLPYHKYAEMNRSDWEVIELDWNELKWTGNTWNWIVLDQNAIFAKIQEKINKNR